MSGLPSAFPLRFPLTQTRRSRSSFGSFPTVLGLRRAGSLRERWTSSTRKALRRALGEELTEDLRNCR